MNLHRMNTTPGRSRPTSISPAMILLADGFTEAPVVESLRLLRMVGVPTYLTTLYAAWARGEHGLVVRADRRLNRSGGGPAPGLLILPGGPVCIQTLLTSPLVYRFVRLGAAPAHIAILREAQATAQAAGLFNDLGLLRVAWQGELSLGGFLQPHIRRLAPSGA